MQNFGKYLIVIGGILILVGVLIVLKIKIPFVGSLPGDINIRRGNTRIYFPLTTCIILSIILSLILRFLRK